MAQRRLLVILLIVATGLVDLGIVAPFANPDAASPEFRVGLTGLLIGLAISQVNLLVALIAWGAVSLRWGLLGVVLASVCLGGLARLLFGPHFVGGTDTRTAVMVILLGQAATTLVLASIARALGSRIVTTGSSSGPIDGIERPRFQFTLGRMFAWITSTAVILGILRYTMHYQTIAALPFGRGLVVACLIHAVLTLLAGWTLLAVNPLSTGILLLGVLTAIVLPIEQSLAGGHWDEVAELVLPQFVWLLAAMVVLRVAGYRLVWRRMRDETAPLAENG